jgi:hypothetical protein
MMSSTVAALGLLLAAPVPNDKAPLAWSFVKNQTFYQEVSIDAANTVTFQGQQIMVTMRETWHFAWTPIRQEKNGNWVLRQKLLGCKLNMDLFGMKIEIDTTKKAEDEKVEAIAKVLREFINGELTLTVDPSMKVVRFEGFKELMARIVKDHPTEAEAFRTTVTEDSFKQYTALLLPALPGKEVGKGDRWPIRSTIAMNPIGTLALEGHYSLVEADRLKLEGRLNLEGGKKPGTPQIKKADIRGELKGEAKVNSKAGLLGSAEFQIKIQGEAVTENNGMEITMQILQNNTLRTRFSDRNLMPK